MTGDEIYDSLSEEEKSAIDFFDLGERELGGRSDVFFNKNIGVFGLLFNRKLNFSFKGARRFIVTASGLLLLNGFFLTILLLKYLFGSISFSGQTFFIFILVGIAVGAYGLYRAYQYVMLEAFYVFYDKFLTKSIEKLSIMLVDESVKVFTKNPNANKSEFNNLLGLNNKLESYLSIFPNFVKNIFFRMFNRIPIAGYLMKFRTFILGDVRQNAIDKIYNAIDAQFRSQIENSISLKWLWWLVPLNIIIYLIIIL